MQNQLTSADRWKFWVEAGGEAASLGRTDKEVALVALVLDPRPDPEVWGDQGRVGRLFGLSASRWAWKYKIRLVVVNLIYEACIAFIFYSMTLEQIYALTQLPNLP